MLAGALEPVRRRSCRKRRALRSLGTLALALGWGALTEPVGAQEVLPTDPPQTLTPSVSVEHLWDDNLFRLPDGVTPDVVPGETERGDQATLTGVGLKFDKVYSLQRFIVSANLLRYDYQNYSYLDFTARNGSANWIWSATPDLTGHLLFNRTDTLNSFADFNAFDQRNIDTNENRRFDADWNLGGALHLTGAIYQLVQTNTVPVFELEDVRINSIEAGLNYQSLAGNSAGFYSRFADGTYLDRTLDFFDKLDTQFTEREAGLRINYAVDGQTSLFGQIGVLSRQHEHFGDRNFHGVVGDLSWTWIFTGRTSALFTATRSLGNYEADNSSYVFTNRYTLGPVYQVTDKTSVSVRLSSTEYRFGGPIIPTTVLRDDHTHAILLTGQWQPVQTVGLTATYTHANRYSSLPGLQFTDQMITLQALVNF
jgi:exopolysaccharide biosynthesis operon protein EpsL